MRSLPNIIITGTPGVGKTTTATQLISLAQNPSSSLEKKLNLKHLSINDMIKSRGCHEGYDAELETLIVDDEKLLDEVTSEISDGEGEGGWVIDWHSTEGFAIRWVDLVVVLRCEDTNVLYDRLMARGYGDRKVQENLDAEIFGTVWDEAVDGWGDGEDEDLEDETEVGVGVKEKRAGRVVQLVSETAEQVEENAERILQWIRNWLEERRGTNGGGE